MQRDIGKPLFDLFLLIASAAAFVAATALPEIEIVGDLSPAFFPKLLSGLIFLFAIPCLIKDFREWWMVRSVASPTPRVVKVRSVAQWMFVVALLVGYMLAFERLGYIISTASFTFSCVLGLVILSGAWGEQTMAQRGKSVLGALVFAAVLAVAVFYVFNNLFEIPLPA